MINLAKKEFKRLYRLARIHGRMVDVGLSFQSVVLINANDLWAVNDVWIDCVHVTRVKKPSLRVRFYRKTGRMLHA